MTTAVIPSQKSLWKNMRFHVSKSHQSGLLHRSGLSRIEDLEAIETNVT